MIDSRVDATKAGTAWPPGAAPIAVVMISLNEGHNLGAVFEGLSSWAQQVFLVDSFSSDDTVEIALEHGVHVVQRRFRGFGDQWNFAIRELPITAPWTMKLDPDERLTDKLKASIEALIDEDRVDGMSFNRRLWFMGRPLPIRQEIVRVWRTGRCRFTDVSVNEHPIVDGVVEKVDGDLEHHDSPDLEHWYEKQNKYSSAEAQARLGGASMADEPRLLGSSFQRRMWLKKHFDAIPFRFFGVFLYYFVVKGLWRAGWVGYAWSRLRSHVYMMRYFKFRELQLLGRTSYVRGGSGHGEPDPRVQQYD